MPKPYLVNWLFPIFSTPGPAPAAVLSAADDSAGAADVGAGGFVLSRGSDASILIGPARSDLVVRRGVSLRRMDVT